MFAFLHLKPKQVIVFTCCVHFFSLHFRIFRNLHQICMALLFVFYSLGNAYQHIIFMKHQISWPQYETICSWPKNLLCVSFSRIPANSLLWFHIRAVVDNERNVYRNWGRGRMDNGERGWVVKAKGCENKATQGRKVSISRSLYLHIAICKHINSWNFQIQ